MNRWVKVLAGAFIAASVLLVGCNLLNPPTEQKPTSDPKADAEALANDAIAAMKDGDYDTALSKFSEALVLDSTNGKVVLGYTMLNLADISVDPALVTMLSNNVGIAGYPTTMNAAVDPNKWMVETVSDWYTDEETGDTTVYGTTLFPQIAGEEDTNGNGMVDVVDRGLALAKFVFTHNTGFNFVPQTVETALGNRLDLVIQTIKESATDSMQFAITWDMVYSQQPTEASGEWPYKNGQPMTIVVGKAEMLALAASLEELRSVVHLAQVYSLSLPLSQYWDYFINSTSGATPPTSLPFTSFLQLNSDAAARLASAKSSMLAAATDSIDSMSSILTNRAGFFLSSDATTGMFDSAGYSDFSSDLTSARQGAQQVQTSLANNVQVYFPINDYTPGSAWPASIVTGQSIGINLGAMFSTPLALVGSSGLIELAGGTGEPTFYREASGQFTAITSATDTVFPEGADFTNSTELAYVHIKDITLNGAIPVANYPPDSLNDQRVYVESMLWIDADLNQLWNNGESIESVTLDRSPNGLLTLSSIIAGYSGSADNYLAALHDPTAAINRIAAAGDIIYPIDGGNSTASDFASALSGLLSSSPSSVSVRTSAPVFVRDDVNGDTHSVYVGVPLLAAWLSLAPSGTTGTDTSGNPVTSQGSIYWYLLSASGSMQ